MTMTSDSNMYSNARTWNPFKGCEFDCTYCGPSFKKQAKRQKQRCDDCYHYRPHTYRERAMCCPLVLAVTSRSRV